MLTPQYRYLKYKKVLFSKVSYLNINPLLSHFP